MANSGFRVMAGWVSAAQINNTTTALIIDFPVQTDQDVGRQWLRPGNDADVVLPYAQLVETPTGHRFRQGGVAFRFPLRILSPDMVQYVQDTLFAGDVHSANLTVQTQNRRGGDWETYNVIGRLPDYGSEVELAAGGYDMHSLSFVNGLAAPDGPDVSPSQEWTLLTAGLEGYVTFTVTNSGTSTSRANATTFADIILTYPIPTKLDLVSVTGSGWDVEYSTDGVSYSATPPSPISNTTHIQCTYAAQLIASGTTNGLIVTVEPNDSGDDTSAVTATTTGDTNTGDDTDTETISIVPRGFDSGFDLGFGSGGFDSGFDSGFDG